MKRFCGYDFIFTSDSSTNLLCQTLSTSNISGLARLSFGFPTLLSSTNRAGTSMCVITSSIADLSFSSFSASVPVCSGSAPVRIPVTSLLSKVGFWISILEKNAFVVLGLAWGIFVSSWVRVCHMTDTRFSWTSSSVAGFRPHFG